jgi:electron transport complex protein RnfD
MKLSVSSSPFKRVSLKTSDMMRWVAVACLPALVTQWYLFGIGSLVQVCLCVLTALLAEAGVLLLRRRPILQTLSDNSAMLTGILLGLAIPPYAPWWIAILGTAFAIILVKQVYGGLGHNLFNPAMAAYVFLLISFPLSMTSWTLPNGLIQHSISAGDGLSLIHSGFNIEGFSLHQLALDVDGMTRATPLDTLRIGHTQGLTSPEVLTSPVFNGFAGVGWLWVNLAFLLGGLFLLWRRIIYWHIPSAFLVTLTGLSMIGYLISPDQTAGPLIHLLSGATMFGAFFILTDPVSASTTPKGRLIYGALVATLVYLIRSFGGYPDAVAFSVLLGNMCVPFIDYLTQPKVYGYQEGNSDD